MKAKVWQSLVEALRPLRASRPARRRERVTLALTKIDDLACRFVPGEAADERLYYETKSWWPAHEIGHFLVATRRECRQYMFGLNIDRRPRYAIAKEIAAMTISQRLLRRTGHKDLADEEIEYTDLDTLNCMKACWCQQAVDALLHEHRVSRLPTTCSGLETLLKRKAREVGTSFYPSRQAAEGLTP